MGMLESRVAKLEVASNGVSHVHVLSIGAAREDGAQAVAQLMPDAKPADVVVILRRFMDWDAAPQLVHRGQ
jgi:hypothetical protein